MDEIWRVAEGTFKNNSVVLFGRKAPYRPNEPDPIPGALAKPSELTPLEFHWITRGNRTAWSDQTPSVQFAGLFVPAPFEQGADIMPRTLLLFETKPAPTAGGITQAEIESIDPVASLLAFAVKDAKKNKSFRMSARVVPSSLLLDVLISNLLTPFDLAAPLKALLPIRKNEENRWSALSGMMIAAMGVPVQDAFNKIGRAMVQRGDLTTIWKKINKRNKLVRQVISSEGYLVLSGAGGKWVCAAFAPMNSFDVGKLVIDQTLYWAQVSSEDEAIYLAGALNSRAVSLTIREFQPRGALGERHVHTLAHRVTPPYDTNQAAHQDVVERTRVLMAEYQSEKALDQRLAELLDPNAGRLPWRRSEIRKKLQQLPSYRAYDEACRALHGVE